MVLTRGHDHDRRIFEGELSESDWKTLGDILDSKDFRELNVPRDVETFVLSDSHPYSISVSRGNTFQNVEFLDSKRLKPYYPQISPLLKWWKALPSRHLSLSDGTADERCSPDRNHPLINN